MTDFAIKNVNGLVDLVIESGQFLTTENLETALAISLFANARATPLELPPGFESLEGYWAEELEEAAPYGSKFWLLDAERQRDEALRKAEEYALESLEWVSSSGLGTVSAEAFFDGDDVLQCRITVTRPTGRDVFAANWDAQEVSLAV